MAQKLLWLFLQSVFLGLLAVFTPFVYTILPLTVGYLSRGAKTAAEKTKNTLYYAGCIIFIFTLVGFIIAVLIRTTGVLKYADHWIFNLFLCRLFFILGLSLLGAFAFKIPASWVNATASRAKAHHLAGIFYMALTLPGSSFASTAPIIVLVLVFAAKYGMIGPITGLFGFSLGLSLPFVFPVIRHVFFSFKSLLNNVKVVLGFFSIVIGLKFLSNADISLGWHILDREVFIAIMILLCVLMGMYLLGVIRLLNDYTPEKNMYGQEYITLPRLFIALSLFCFAVYLLPGMWGAPLKGISHLLPA